MIKAVSRLTDITDNSELLRMEGGLAAHLSGFWLCLGPCRLQPWPCLGLGLGAECSVSVSVGSD